MSDEKQQKITSRNKTAGEKEIILNHLTKLYLRGYSFIAMSKWLKANTDVYASDKACSAYVKQILNSWHKERVEDVDKLITAELMGLHDLEREAWAAWELSKKDKTKSVTRKKGTPRKNSDEINTTSFEQLDEVISGVGDPRFLDIVRDCKDKRMQYLQKLKFGGGFNDAGGVVFNQQIVHIGVVDRKPSPDAQTVIEVPAQ